MKKKLWNKNFILLLQGSAVSTIGDVMYAVAIGYWVFQKTGSTALMGIMSSISMFVTMFLSPFCGSIVDKCNRKWLIVCIDAVQGLIMLTVGVLAYLDALNVPIVLLAALLASFGSVFYAPAISTIMLDIIPKDDLVRGQSVHSGISSLINLMGTAFSGAMVAFFGVPLIVVINGVSNLYSAISELFVSVPKSKQEEEKVTVKGVFKDSLTAGKTIFSDKCLKIFIPCALLINLLAAGPLALFLPFCMESGYSVDEYGYVVGIFSFASVVGMVLLGSLKLKPQQRFWFMSLGFVLSIPFNIVVYFSQTLLTTCLFAFLAGLFNSIGNAVFNASMMLAMPEENRNAILGFVTSASVGGSALSSVIYGFIGEFFPLYLVFSIGTALALPIMIYMSFHPTIKNFVLTVKEERPAEV